MLKLKSLSPLFATLAIASAISAGDVAVHSFLPKFQNTAIAAPEMTVQQKIDIISKSKGQVGSGDQLRRFFYGDLLPLGVQPGGAGMVVNLYNKANNVTFSYCATYDVVVAVKQGRVASFPAAEVK
ncbi:MAG: hypothetical protein JGK17_22680 [Microcoleus sp. PH2017_10_PVI_O_A]|uniref:hypothetical protein n=1 Tax=unclassified Microcoleus TaxID=2642155 RepID=UPI001E036C14|nr:MULTISPECIES: hypothetical protein [unclassified Microcoleus]TAE78562.1 MAG: hypothetical protein EAZ83_24690 [Oscillatoriales cyanobacterium]MCC3408341.1 hypothetical protein [Microcoleus sp. PH2017_10_PVI_O_A]MCC3462400.1 hypothetical protein [Microcoleus sp. PH2017_11_PCY_U_A]MCC3480890.1 hypothetical protein [Microcoleus sp. PH2017_12_PCY_D_A]MCC3527685.1 hypothetical protein [Microcoleus sp. PH2017_21_RUC_O_A]